MSFKKEKSEQKEIENEEKLKKEKEKEILDDHRTPEEKDGLSKYETILWQIFNLRDQEEPTKSGVVFNIINLVTLMLNIIILILETDSFLMSFWSFAYIVFSFEVFYTIYFTLEVAITIYTSYSSRRFRLYPSWARRLRFFVTFWNLFDQVTLLLQYYYISFVTINFIIIRPVYTFALHILQLFRIIRMLRIIVPLNGFSVIFRVILLKWKVLMISFINLITCVILFAVIIFTIENRVQPENFESIPRTLYYTLVTISTLGYGDIFPRSWWGRAFVGACVFIPFALYGIPVSIISQTVVEEMRREIRARNNRKEMALIKKKRKEEIQKTVVDDIFDDLDQLEKQQNEELKKQQESENPIEKDVPKDWKNEEVQLILLKDISKILVEAQSLEILCPKCKDKVTPFQG